jgi:hypothetical protein
LSGIEVLFLSVEFDDPQMRVTSGMLHQFRVAKRASSARHRYQGLRSSGETVVIDGLCASACTIVLNAVPHDKICVTSRATLGFHAAWNFGAEGRTITDREATLTLYSMYPMPVQRWIAARGGLTPHMIFLRGKVLQAMYKPCYIDAHYAGF